MARLPATRARSRIGAVSRNLPAGHCGQDAEVPHPGFRILRPLAVCCVQLSWAVPLPCISWPPHHQLAPHTRAPPPAVVEEQLAGVQPILDAARAAVGGIKSEHLSEVRSLRMAPDAIRCVAQPRKDCHRVMCDGRSPLSCSAGSLSAC